MAWPRRPDEANMRRANVADVILGALIFLTPWIANVTNGWLFWSDVVAGGAIALLAVLGIGVTRQAPEAASAIGFFNMFLGGWVFLMAFSAPLASVYFAFNLVLGAAVVGLSTFNLFAGAERAGRATR